ncbi:DUF1707 and DUF4190 domain-containing protein [Streptomyces sp. NPDC058632]|uniref:DUF1707 and DUF4190 domain-containing protein n=1 Tax=unclassified Streptomyces TaxID=2593676 RepID=UPI00365CBF62
MSQSPYPSWQPWQGRGVPQPWGGPGGPVGPPQGGPPMLASHADRERTVDVLRAGYAEGRLDQPELERRVARAYQARTVADLTLLVADLPQGPAPQTAVMQHAAAAMPPATFLARPPKTNEKAVGAMVCGVLCLATGGLTGIPAVILGHVARTEIRRTGESGDGYAMTGLVLGWLSTAGWALLIMLMVLFSASG